MSTFSLFLAFLWCIKPIAVIIPIVFLADKLLMKVAVD